MKQSLRVRTPGDIGIVLQQARLALGLSQNEPAAETDLPQSTISAIENGMSTIHLRRTTGILITASWQDDVETDG